MHCNRLNVILFLPDAPVPSPVHATASQGAYRTPAKLLTELSTRAMEVGEQWKNNDLAHILASVTDDSEAYNL
jgi:hypothetical protein